MNYLKFHLCLHGIFHDNGFVNGRLRRFDYSRFRTHKTKEEEKKVLEIGMKIDRRDSLTNLLLRFRWLCYVCLISIFKNSVMKLNENCNYSKRVK